MKKPQSVALFTKPGCDNDFSYTKKAIEILSKYNITTYLPKSLQAEIPKEAPHLVEFLPDETAMTQSADMMLVLGGDGTMIGYSVLAAELGKPTAGVNLGTLGFLTALERTEIEGLSALGEGDFTTEDRMLLDVVIEDEQGEIIHRQRILNDVIITSGMRSKIAEFSLFSQNGKILDYRSDGLIVATPTGSTAYSFPREDPSSTRRQRSFP